MARHWTRLLPIILAGPLLCCGQATITVFAGTGGPPPINSASIGDGGPATKAFLAGPASLAVDDAGNIYIWEFDGYRVRKVTPAGIITTIAGNGTAGDAGDGGPATSAQLGLGVHAGLAVDSAGNVYIADTSNHRIRKVDTLGKISTVAGVVKGTSGSSGDGGLATNAALCTPTGMAVDSAGNLYFGSSVCGGVRKVDPSGTITTVAKSDLGVMNFDVDVDHAGNLYLATTLIRTQIRKMTPDGNISVIAGTGVRGFSGDGGPAASAQLSEVNGLAVDKAGNVYISDYGNLRIREVNTAGMISTIAEGGTSSCPNLRTTGCAATDLKFGPFDVAVDKSGNVYTANFIKGLVYKISGLGGSGTGPSSGSTPAIASGGIIAAGAYGGFKSAAAGSFIEIYGTNLASTTADWGSSFNAGNAPTTLAGVQVRVGGQPAFVAYVKPSQVNALLPSSLPAGPVQVTVANAAGTSQPYTLNVTATEPGLLAPNSFVSNGKQYAGALFPDYKTFAIPSGTFAGVPSRAAKAGDTLILYGLGFGPVTPNLNAGALVTQSNQLADPFTISIGGVPVAPQYDGLAPGYTGLYQINIQVPSNAPKGDFVPLTFTLNNTAGSQMLYIAIQ